MEWGCGMKKRRIVIPTKATKDELAILEREQVGGRESRQVFSKRINIRCVAFITKEELDQMLDDQWLGLTAGLEGNQVLARGRALRTALQLYLASMRKRSEVRHA